MNLANLLTISRIFLAPIFAALYFMDGWGWALAAFAISIIIEITDLYDGRVARGYGIVSDLGKLLDPFADRLSRFTIFLVFLVDGLAPLWMIIIFYFRDEFVSLMRMLAAKRDIVIAARQSGKIKAVTQGIAINVVLFLRFVMIAAGASEEVIATYLQGTAWVLLLVVTIVTVVSWVDYMRGSMEVIRSYEM